MAGRTDPQKQLLTLIRDFASEKSHGERRIVGLKKRIEELRSELNAENAELEEAKLLKETDEQELKGYEVELAWNDASIQTLETRICQVQDEISLVGSEVDGLKNEEGTLRDEFIGKMFELNARIRKFHESMACKFQKENSIGATAEPEEEVVMQEVVEADSKALEDKLADVLSEIAKEEEAFLAAQNIQKELQQEQVDIEKKVSLMELIVKETKALQDLARQTSELEQTCASLGEELQKRCICPNCNLDNVEAMGGILQASEAR